jgi:hypothetical protein
LKHSIEEQQLQMDIIRMQIPAEKAHATFFEKAGMTLNGQHHMEISSSVEGHYQIPL